MVSDKRGALLLAAVLLGPLAVFAVDALTPKGVEVWVLYLPLILAAVRVESARGVAGVGLACSGLVLAGACLSSSSEAAPPWHDLLNRGTGLLALGLMALAGVTISRRSADLARAVRQLQREADQHQQARRALAESEERLRLAVDGAGMGTWDANLITGHSVWSDSLFRMLGYPPAPGGQASLALWAARVHPDDRDRADEQRHRARRLRAPYADECRIARADTGEVVWLSLFGRFLYDPSGAASRFVGVAFDVTPRKKLERDVLEAASQEQRRIGQELHDGVGQELTGIALMADALLQRLPEGGRDKEIASRLAAELDRLHQQVRALAAGLIPVAVEAQGLRAALEDLAARASAQSGLPVTFAARGADDGPDHATATELFRIASEAVHNALRHARARRVHIDLHAGPDGLCLTVRDDGRGPPAPHERGGGNGLHIMRYRADQIGAALHIDPAEGGGTVVTCRLPGRSAHAEKTPGDAPPAQSPHRG